MHSAGHRIWLDKQLQLTHCNRYTFASLVRSDFFGRAIPWAHLMLKRRIFQNDLNTRLSNVVSVPVSVLLLAAPLSIRSAWVGTVALTLIMLFLVLNRGFLKFVLWQRGWRFTLEAAVMTWFAYLYSALGALAGFAGYLRERLSGSDEMEPDA